MLNRTLKCKVRKEISVEPGRSYTGNIVIKIALVVALKMVQFSSDYVHHLSMFGSLGDYCIDRRHYILYY